MHRLNMIGDIVDLAYKKGIMEGRRQMEGMMIHASETGQPIEIHGKVWFVKSDMQNLRGIFHNLRSELCEGSRIDLL